MITIRLVLTLFVVACALVASVSAQSFYIGPKFEYTISTSVPQEVSAAGSPVRVNLGIIAVVPVRSTLEIRMSALYRIENGSFATFYVEPSGARRGSGRLDVVDPAPGGPQIISTIETTSIEFSTALYFPLADLDTSGSQISVGLGALVDRFTSGTQVDDYSNVPSLSDSTATFELESHFGFGALFGLGITLPAGSDRISFDMQVVFRLPSDVPIEGTDPQQDANVRWLVGGGLRLGLSYQFGI